MKKQFLALAAAIALTSASFASVAEAGGCGKGGFRGFSHGPSFSHRFQSSRSDAFYARQKAKAVAAAAAARKRAIAEKIAEKRERIAAAQAAAKRAAIAARIEERRKLAAKRAKANAEVAAVEQVETVEQPKVAAVTPPAPEQKIEKTVAKATTKTDEPKVASASVGCKRYIPSAGLTVTVPCE